MSYQLIRSKKPGQKIKSNESSSTKEVFAALREIQDTLNAGQLEGLYIGMVFKKNESKCHVTKKTWDFDSPNCF